MQLIDAKSNEQIEKEWDAIAATRSAQIRSGKDISMNYVLVPAVLKLMPQRRFEGIIDVGCGCGYLTEKLASFATRVVGIDLSQANIDIARKHGKSTNLIYEPIALESYATDHHHQEFDVAVANMSLMAILDLEAATCAISHLLKPAGHLIFTICHPCFWPMYWNYPEPFSYRGQTIVEAPFKISQEVTENFITTHVHRPLEMYVASLKNAGFQLAELMELLPEPAIEEMYPEKWKFPRFIGCRFDKEI